MEASVSAKPDIISTPAAAAKPTQALRLPSGYKIVSVSDGTSAYNSNLDAKDIPAGARLLLGPNGSIVAMSESPGQPFASVEGKFSVNTLDCALVETLDPNKLNPQEQQEVRAFLPKPPQGGAGATKKSGASKAGGNGTGGSENINSGQPKPEPKVEVSVSQLRQEIADGTISNHCDINQKVAGFKIRGGNVQVLCEDVCPPGVLKLQDDSCLLVRSSNPTAVAIGGPINHTQ